MLRAAWRDLNHAVEEFGAGAHVSRYQLQASWGELVGSRLAQHSQPYKMQGRTLLVVTRGPIWSQELMIQQGGILPAIQQRFPKLKVQGLRCRVGTLRSHGETPAPPPPPELTRIPLSPAVERRIEGLASQVTDPDLRRSFRRALRQQEKRKIWLRDQGAIECMDCGALQELRVCRGCIQEDRRRRRQLLFQLLGREPWITYQEAADQIRPLTQGDFHQARRQLLSIQLRNFYELRADLKEGQPLPSGLRQLLVQICMLSTATPWDQLQDKHVKYSLGKIWGQAYIDDKAPVPRPKFTFQNTNKK